MKIPEKEVKKQSGDWQRSTSISAQPRASAAGLKGQRSLGVHELKQGLMLMGVFGRLLYLVPPTYIFTAYRNKELCHGWKGDSRDTLLLHPSQGAL